VIVVTGMMLVFYPLISIFINALSNIIQ